jgi:hypothetical protein
MSARPHGNTYWAAPDLLLAGEYPGAAHPALVPARLQCYLDCGIRHFIDLTQEGELQPYAGELARLADEQGLRVSHQRFGIPDKSVPGSYQQMDDILHAIHALQQPNEAVYVHCWGGIGRTGTVISCLLAQELGSAELAVAELNRLWQQMSKKDRWPRSPETAEQLAWIHAWHAAQHR